MFAALYNLLFIGLVYPAIRLGALFHPKLRLAAEGRRNLFPALARGIEPFARRPRIVFHCTSVGEWEQVKPIIARLKESGPDLAALVCFFSPSGYELARGSKAADLIAYCPFDLPWQARRFFALVRPKAYVIVRYDIWPNHVRAATDMGIPVLLVNATLQPRSRRLWPGLRAFFRCVYGRINRIFSVSEEDAARLRLLCRPDRVTVAGDTRFDQVLMRRQRREIRLPDLMVPQARTVLVAGSTYGEDEERVIPAFAALRRSRPDLFMVLVPHEPSPVRIQEISGQLRKHGIKFATLSGMEAGGRTATDVLLVDRVGILAELYALGALTFVGGSFHGRVHNVMEPAVMGKPVLFGPDIHNSHEAALLVDAGGGRVVRDIDELARTVGELLDDPGRMERLGRQAHDVIMGNTGATDKIARELREAIC